MEGLFTALCCHPETGSGERPALPLKCCVPCVGKQWTLSGPQFPCLQPGDGTTIYLKGLGQDQLHMEVSSLGIVPGIQQALNKCWLVVLTKGSRVRQALRASFLPFSKAPFWLFLHKGLVAAREFCFIKGSCASQARSTGSVTFCWCLLLPWTPAVLCGTLALPPPTNTTAHLSSSQS